MAGARKNSNATVDFGLGGIGWAGMKQEINFLSVYQAAQPAFSAKHVLSIWFASIICMCVWNLFLVGNRYNEQAKLTGMQQQNIQYAAQLQNTSHQLQLEHGRSLSESIKSLTEKRAEKEQLLKEVSQLKEQGPDLTYYLKRIAEDHVAGTLIDFVSIEKGQKIKMIGRSETAQLVPEILSSWENVKLNDTQNISQFKMQKMKGDKAYVNFIIQVQ
jgi:hypothetical protein